MAQSANPTQITPSEEAARRSRSGYAYQDSIAVSFFLQMFRDSSLQKVACETQDDVVLTWDDGNGHSTDEFVQVKSDRLKQQWSVAQFCEQEIEPPSEADKAKKAATRYRKDTSIFEKNALRDRRAHASRFRVVTRADVNELRVLTEPSENRMATDTSQLAEKLQKKLDVNTTLTKADIEYWVANSTWDVHGDESATFNENFRRLSEAVQAQEQRLLAVVDLERILHRLTDEAQAMAIGKGRLGINPSSVTKDELQSWLATELRLTPNFIGVAESDVLLREERHSLARCEALWLALGVPKSDATALARQPDIGARADFFASLTPGFHWITATYGAGKSIAVERLFQKHIADYIVQRDMRVPIFLRAYGFTGSLQDAVLKQLRELHRDAGAPPLFVILDAVDEAGASRAYRLLQESIELSSTWPESIFIATSANLPFAFDQFQKRLPNLTDEEAAEIVSRFALYETSPWLARERLGSDSGLALMCVLLGLALRETADAAPSRAELLNFVVESARKRSGVDTNQWAEEADVLCRIAMLSTDSGGGPVRPSDLGMTSVEMISLANTRLVIEESGALIFTVATMRLWFAAQALRKGWVDEVKLVADLPRVRHWQEALAIFVATTDFDSASRYFEPLAARHPAIAAQVIADATSQWGDGVGRQPTEYTAFALRVRRCLEVWLRGIAPLAAVCDFTDSQGDLLKVRTGFSAPHTVIVFSRDRSLPAVSSLPTDWNNTGVEQYHLYRESDQPSHLWRQTQAMVRIGLLAFIEKRQWERSDPALFHEEVWNQVAAFAGVSRWFTDSVPWDVIDRFEQIFRQLNMWGWLCEKRIAFPEAFIAPHPPADVKDETISWIPNLFSPSAALSRAQSTYGMAFAAYQRIVQKYFPNFQYDLRHSAWWPCRLVGKVGQAPGGPSLRGWWISYHCEPVDSEKDALVALELGVDQNYGIRSDFETLREATARLRPNAPAWYWAQSAALNFYDSHPATVITKRWLLEDIAAAGWKR